MGLNNDEVMRGANAAFNAGNFDGAFAHMHPEVSWRDMQALPDAPGSGVGVEGLRRMAMTWVAAFDDFRSDLEDVTQEGDWVYCTGRWSGRMRGNDTPVSQFVVDAYEMRDGQAVQALMSFPSLDAARQATQAA